MNEIKINNIDKFFDSLTRDEAVEAVKILVVENEKLKRLNDGSIALFNRIEQLEAAVEFLLNHIA